MDSLVDPADFIKKGYAPIKKEYLKGVHKVNQKQNSLDTSQEKTNQNETSKILGTGFHSGDLFENTEHIAKDATDLKIDLNKINEKKLSENNLKRKEERITEQIEVLVNDKIMTDEVEANEELQPKKKKLRGMNKKRPKQKRLQENEKLCTSIIEGMECPYGDGCKYSHDKEAYLAKHSDQLPGACSNFDQFGWCRYGVTCMFRNAHGTPPSTVTLSSVTTPASISTVSCTPSVTTLAASSDSTTAPTSNRVSRDLQMRLRRREYCFKVTNDVLKELSHDKVKNSGKTVCSGDEEAIRTRPKEKKMIDFRGKTYLAPLTTVGNLPFRRVCKDMGVDVTCGEMCLSTSLLQGQLSEWALLKRHSCEKFFGVQVCGTKAENMAKAAQVISENACVDFIDINIGCPIDLVFKKGNGSAMMSRMSKLQHAVRATVAVTDLPVTLKMRTGIQEDKKLAHSLIPRLSQLHLNLLTMHGRSREQRYTRLADWDYIRECSSLAKPTQFFGNGDVLSGEEYWQRLEEYGVDGAMIARGALIKPWIFREIDERRLWDIQATERLQVYKDFVRYGLEHWGSDRQGIENTRKFLLEWLSFTHRYIPVGLLEVLPQKINQKPLPFFARTPLETLLASPNCADWLKITEMVLAPVPKDYSFLPKHKANSYQ